MHRRNFITLSAAALITPAAAFAAETLKFRPGTVYSLLREGKTVFVDVYTDWCSTCRAQGRAIEALREENPAYDAAMTFVKVDWDVHYRSAFTVDYQIVSRATLMVLRGDDVLGRIDADTSKDAIRALMDKGLPGA